MVRVHSADRNREGEGLLIESSAVNCELHSSPIRKFSWTKMFSNTAFIFEMLIDIQQDIFHRKNHDRHEVLTSVLEVIIYLFFVKQNKKGGNCS